MRTWFAAILFLVIADRSVAEIRSIDGVSNHQTHASWGAAGTIFRRQVDAAYDDGVGDLLNESANPRLISNLLYRQATSIPNPRKLSNMVWQWGQFLDHDITFSENAPSYGVAPIRVPQPDPDGMMMIPFSRTKFEPHTGSGLGNPRQQINSVTSYIDGSQIYGSSHARSNALRSFRGGRLKTSGTGRGLLPTNRQDEMLAVLPNEDGGLSGNSLFVSGDVRVNENPGLTALHTIFLREHNRLAEALAESYQDDPTWDDEKIFQTARKIVGAELQHITYREFLPALLGENLALAAETAEYQEDVNPSVSNVFATALFRFGHSMLTQDLMMMDESGLPMHKVGMRDAFFRPDLILDADEPDGLIAELIMGMSKQVAENVDVKIVEDVRSFLFAPTTEIGMDLAALNIQRGRDHGLASYNAYRLAFGLDPVRTFAEMTSDSVAQQQLASLYLDVDQVDVWVGALVEDHLPESSVGPLVKAALVDQFQRLRDGDRFFYTRDPDFALTEFRELVDFDTFTLTQVIERNTGLNGLENNLFIVPEPTSLYLLFASVWPFLYVVSRYTHA